MLSAFGVEHGEISKWATPKQLGAASKLGYKRGREGGKKLKIGPRSLSAAEATGAGAGRARNYSVEHPFQTLGAAGVGAGIGTGGVWTAAGQPGRKRKKKEIS